MASEQTLQRAADEGEIRNLIARIAMTADTGDLDDFVNLYAQDARVEMRSPAGGPPLAPPDEGVAAIVAGSKQRRADGITGPGSGMVHALQTSAIAVSGDAARAQTYLVLYRNAHTKPDLSAILIYNDAFVRTAQGWRLKERTIEPVRGG